MNIKNLFIFKGLSRKKIIEFMDKKGFYVVLLVCLLIVGATAAYVTTANISSTRNNLDLEKEYADIANEKEEKILDKPKYKEPVAASIDTERIKNTNAQNQSANEKIALNDNAVKEQKVSPSVKEDNNIKASAEQNKEVFNQETQDFAMPVFGKVTFEYSNDKLVYSKTLGEWRTHSGVDLGSDRGTSVKAVADGVVKEIKNDPGYGIMIVIEHSNGLKSVYGNMASADMVSTNLKVKQGEIIGAVGNTAAFEAIEPSHLHFEVLKNNEPVDPSNYLTLKK